MPELENDIDTSSLGEFTGADAPPKAEEPSNTPPKPEAPPKDDPKPEAKPTAKAEPEDDPEPEPEFDPDYMTVDELRGTVKQVIQEFANDERARLNDEADETPEETKTLRAENARLKGQLDTANKTLAEVEEQAALGDLQSKISSAKAKYMMTKEEVGTVVKYMEGNEDLVRGGMEFEEAALRRLPGLADRLRTEPPPQKPRGSDGGDGVLGAPGAGGPPAPKPWKHTVTAGGGDYSDITQHQIDSGEAALLGKYI